MSPSQYPPDCGAPATGRKRDASRDAAIIDAAIDVLAEVDYDRVTVEMIATRAKAGKGAVYRRWSSKTALVLDAVAQMKRDMVDLDRLPDTGTLRGDLLALFEQCAPATNPAFARAVSGLSAVVSQGSAVAPAGHDALIEPWIEANRVFIDRAVTRGQTAAGIAIDVMARVLPTLAGYRSLVQRRYFERDFLIETIDHVLLPALGIANPAPPTTTTGT